MLLLPAGNPQEVIMTNLNSNPGILPYKVGLAKVRSKSHSFLHYFDLEPIKNEIQYIQQIKKNLTTAINVGLSHPYFIELDNFLRVLNYQLTATEQKFNSLSPSHRVKRGLINGLGSIIKSISGNLDADDAAHYDEAINELENNQKEIVQTVNHQISLTSEILKNFNQTVTLIKSNQEIIAAGLNKIRSELNTFVFEFNDYLETRNILDQVNLSLSVILQLLSDVENAVTFARLGTFHSSILKISELKSIIESAVKYYGASSLFFPNYDRELHKYYELLEIEAYYSGSKIVFVIHFPIVYPETFTYYHLYSIPTGNSSTIIPKDTYLIMNENFYQYASLPCKKLHPDYYCPNDHLLDGILEGDCIFQLLQLETAPKNCNIAPALVKGNIIQQIDEAHYIAILPNRTKFETICGRTDFTTLQGTYLIYIPYQCQFITGKQLFINEKPTSNGQPMLLPEIKITHQKVMENTPQIVIQDVQLDKIHQLQDQQAAIQPIHLAKIDRSTFNYWLIPLWIIVIATCIWYGSKVIMKKKRQPQMVTNQTEAAPTRAFFNP